MDPNILIHCRVQNDHCKLADDAAPCCAWSILVDKRCHPLPKSALSRTKGCSKATFLDHEGTRKV